MNTRKIKQRMMAYTARYLPGYDGTLRYMRVEGDHPQVILQVSRSAARESGLLKALTSDAAFRVAATPPVPPQGGDPEIMSIAVTAAIPSPPYFEDLIPE